MTEIYNFIDELNDYKFNNKIVSIENASKKAQELFSNKLLIIINLWLIQNNDEIDDLINEDLFFAKFVKKSTPIKSSQINSYNLEIWLRKKMLERCAKWKNFSEANELAKLKKEKWLEKISNEDFKFQILSGEIIIENKIEFSSIENDETPEDKKIKKHMDIIKNNVNSIKRIILNDIQKHHYFITENLGDITPMINKIYTSLRVLRKISDRLDDEFKELKVELVKWLNRDEWIIRSCLFKINQIVNSL